MKLGETSDSIQTSKIESKIVGPGGGNFPHILDDEFHLLS